MTTKIYNKNYRGITVQSINILNVRNLMTWEKKERKMSVVVVKRNRFGMGIIMLHFLTEGSPPAPLLHFSDVRDNHCTDCIPVIVHGYTIPERQHHTTPAL